MQANALRIKNLTEKIKQIKQNKSRDKSRVWYQLIESKYLRAIIIIFEGLIDLTNSRND